VSSGAAEEAETLALHPLLAARWSPTRFDPEHLVSEDEVELLLEAARWAPSAGNSQPWSFIVARRGDATHVRLVRHLAGSSARWAPTASLLVVNLAHRYVEDTDWDYSEFAQYDLGQAVAHMTFQAQALGLQARQFRAFNRASLAAEFDVPGHWEPTTMSALGRSPRAGGPDPTRSPRGEQPVRVRREVRDLLWAPEQG
jgi:nitroreductase